MGYILVISSFLAGLCYLDRSKPRGLTRERLLPKHGELRYVGHGRWERCRSLRERGADRLTQLLGWLRERVLF
jgi:hypothetical protein